MLLFTHTFPHHPSGWWLYLLTYALLAVTVISVLFETSQGLSRGLSRLRLWLAGSGAALFCVLVVTTQRLLRPMLLAGFVKWGAGLCALLPRLDRYAASAVSGAAPTQSAALRIGKGNVCRNVEHAVPGR